MDPTPTKFIFRTYTIFYFIPSPFKFYHIVYNRYIIITIVKRGDGIGGGGGGGGCNCTVIFYNITFIVAYIFTSCVYFVRHVPLLVCFTLYPIPSIISLNLRKDNVHLLNSS